jgi:RNA polymerase sigma-70 factor (family 1)
MHSNKLWYSKAPDAELFRYFKKSDAYAFEELYKRHWNDLVKRAYRQLNSKEKAEDIVQNIFIDLYRRRSTIEVSVALKTYLYQALKFKVLNEYRSQSVKTRYLKNVFLNAGRENDFAKALEAKELAMKLDMIMMELPDKCRQVFHLSRKENLSNRDISMGLNITVSTVEKHISKALKRLRFEVQVCNN